MGNINYASPVMTAFQILDSENGREDNGVFKTWKKLNHIGQIQAGETPQTPKYGTDGGSQVFINKAEIAHRQTCINFVCIPLLL